MAPATREPGGLARVVWTACLLAGTSTHALTVVQHGWAWDYGGGWPLLTRLFWTSLTGLDPLAAGLLYAHPRSGVLLTAIIMLTDVAQNSWALMTRGGPAGSVILQAIFLGYVLGTAPQVWRAPRAGAKVADG